MEIKLYVMSKKKNSTAYPAYSGFTAPHATLDGVVNFDVSITNISVTFSNVVKNNYTLYRYNYLYVSNVKRYYWVTDWSINANGTLTAICSVDVLATYNSNISGGTAYIKRCSNPSIANDAVADSFYPPVNDYVIRKTIAAPGWIASGAYSWTYILAVVSNNLPAYGAVDYYIISRSEMRTLINNLMANFNANDQPSNWKAQELSNDMLKTLVSPMQYIKGCKAIPVITPFPSQGESTAYSTIYAGNWNTGAKGIKLYDAPTAYQCYRPEWTDSFTISIPKNIDNNVEIPNTVRYPPYADYTLNNYIFGVIPIDGMIASRTDSLTIAITTNLINGSMRMDVLSGSGTSQYLVTRQYVNVSIDIPIADISYNYMGMAKSALSAVGSATSWKAWTDPGQNAVKIASDVLDTVAYSKSPSVTSTGSVGGACANGSQLFELQARFIKRTDPDPSHFGYPVNKRYGIGACVQSGVSSTYVVAFDPIIESSVWNSDSGGYYSGMLDTERDAIIGLLADGVYLEGSVTS